MSITYVTGNNHSVTPAEDAVRVRGIVGDLVALKSIGGALSAQIIDNNTIRVSDGVLIAQGRQIIIADGTYENFTIESGTAGTTRTDIIGFTITDSAVTKKVWKNGADLDDDNDFWDGDSSIDVALYKVNIDGINITSIESLFDLYEAGGVTTEDPVSAGSAYQPVYVDAGVPKLANGVKKTSILCNTVSGHTPTAKTIYLARSGNVVQATITISSSTGAANAVYNNIFTIPDGYRPTITTHVAVSMVTSNMVKGMTRYTIGTDGKCAMITDTSGLYERWATVTWITSDAMPA